MDAMHNQLLRLNVSGSGHVAIPATALWWQQSPGEGIDFIGPFMVKDGQHICSALLCFGALN